MRRTRALAAHFEGATGLRLRVTPSRRRDPTPVPVDHLEPTSPRSQFGRFQLLVVSDAREAQEHVAFADPDENGIHWEVAEVERGPEAGSLVAVGVKLYGGDVVLTWSRDDGVPEADTRWEQLDQVLTDFVAA
jgi:hypothetical protein